uniref:Uncharacterized protein n=1 Tax=Aegilops tauschii subsp. strangulata TaxID=200361 RepID=A0A452YC51_AEGTS
MTVFVNTNCLQVLAAYGEEEKGHEPEDILFTRIVENLVNVCICPNI